MADSTSTTPTHVQATDASQLCELADGLVNDNSETADKLDEFTVRRLSEVALALEIQRQLRLLYPCNSLFRYANQDDAKLEVRPVYSRLLNLYSLIQQHLKQHSVDPDDSKFQYNTKPVSESAKNRRTLVFATFDQSWAAPDTLLGHMSTQDDATQTDPGPTVVDSIEHVFSEVQATHIGSEVNTLINVLKVLAYQTMKKYKTTLHVIPAHPSCDWIHNAKGCKVPISRIHRQSQQKHRRRFHV